MQTVTKQVRRYPDFELDALDLTGLNERDAAFASFLYNAVITRWDTIRPLLEKHLSKPWRMMVPPAQSALFVGAAQILFMDRVPVHAAVHESVSWVKANGGLSSGSLVNAILRRMGELVSHPRETDPSADVELPPPPNSGEAPPPPREETQRVFRETWSDRTDELPLADGRAIVLTDPEALHNDPMRRLAVATSTPLELLKVWAKSISLQDVRRIAHHGVSSPPVILNTQHATGPLPPEALTPHNVPGHHVYVGLPGGLGQLLRGRSDIWVQDPASTLAVGSVADLEPSFIIDACAGMGTKTRQIANAFPNAKVLATDIDVLRRQRLEQTFEGHERVKVIPFGVLDEFALKADLVMLDVPCSNTGVLARRPEARYRVQERRTEQLLSMQRQIIADAVRLLRMDGKAAILYSTCSLDPRENEEQARWAQKWHDFEITRESRRLPEGGPGQPPQTYTDGSYAVLLTR